MKNILAVTALAVTLSGCSYRAAGEQTRPRSITAEPASQESRESGGLSADILGSWTLVAVDGEPVAINQHSIKFDPGFFYANVNCNKVSGFYSLRGTRFAPDKAVATERGCGSKHALDAAFTRALQFGMTVTMPTKDRLSTEAGGRQLTFVRVVP